MRDREVHHCPRAIASRDKRATYSWVSPVFVLGFLFSGNRVGLRHNISGILATPALPETPMMKKLALILSLSFATATMAADMTCNGSVAEKKLAGAAKTSFLKKCEKDAVAMCQASSKEKKLAGAAKTSHEKKCLKDAVG